MGLQTSYMGIPLRNPLIVGASSYTARIDTLKKLQDAGAGAVVLKSLFEEQIQLEQFEFDEEVSKFEDSVSPEMHGIYPHTLEFNGVEEHIMWIRAAKKALSIPVIASINAVNKETWVKYARDLADTGVDGLELNVYSVPQDFSKSGAAVEQEQIDYIKAVVDSVPIPVSVKLTPFYSNPLHFMAQLDKAGIRGLVLFNRLFQPKIDVEKQQLVSPPYLSSPEELRMALRFTGIASGNVSTDLCTSTGITKGADAASAILAGASAFQVVSSLYKNRIEHIPVILGELESWMSRKGYSSIEDFKGALSKKEVSDPWAYLRAQYINILWRANQILENARIQ